VTCSSCASEAIRNDVLNRRVVALEADVRELERERRGLLAEVARLKSQALELATQITRTP
jgi:cell division protein FtsB